MLLTGTGTCIGFHALAMGAGAVRQPTFFKIYSVLRKKKNHTALKRQE